MTAKRAHPARRGLALRALGALIGAVVAAALVVAMQLPLLHRAVSPVVRLRAEAVVTPPLDWPSQGSAALVVPALHVATSVHDRVAPIASLTKLMTAYVTLDHLPLSSGETGPCVVVSEADVELYQAMNAVDESSVKVAVGEQLCESDLLGGMLVHSAGNYAVMLADMVAGSSSAFVADMNETAARLHLTGTHYHDVTGISPLSVSTALDQARLTARLMQYPIVRQIVRLPSITLPVAGTVSSFTPFVGEDGVVGVKSGRTIPAGGCDVLALTFDDRGHPRLAIAAVTDQRGGDLLGPAGDAALALARSAVADLSTDTLDAGVPLGTLDVDGHSITFGLTSDETVGWWPADAGLHFAVRVRTLHLPLARGATIGDLIVRGATTRIFPLRAFGALPEPTWRDRLL